MGEDSLEKTVWFRPVGFGRRVRDSVGEKAAICPRVCLHDLAPHKTVSPTVD